MFIPRVIPVLLLEGRGLVKTVRFKSGKYIGDPINAVKLFNDLKADELVFLDICASRRGRPMPIDLISEIAAEANMPFSVGGGITRLEDIQKMTAMGAERVVIGTEALLKPDFIRDAADNFGSSTVSVCMDVRAGFFGKKVVWSHATNRNTKFDPIAFAKLMEDKGAGEIIVQSVDNDGGMQGYDTVLLKAVSQAVTIPVVALGGAGNLSHLREAWQDGCASAVGAGSLFVYQGSKRGVLINYPPRPELRQLFD